MTLLYSNINELQKAAEIPAVQKNIFHKYTCERAFETFKKLFSEAGGLINNPEGQYILYSRCGDIAKLIIQKNGFETFGYKTEFGNMFKRVLSQIDTLTNIVSQKYKDLANQKSLPIVEKIAESEPMKAQTFTIQPKELVRIIQNEKKSAVILDFREDQSHENINYTKNVNPITVVSIPRHLIQPGLTFQILKTSVPIVARPLLGRLQTADYIVLMDQGDTALINGVAPSHTIAGILNLAITSYNIREMPKSTPLYMEGGFNKWCLQYPTYVRHENGHSVDNQDFMQKLIANYKKACLPGQFPDASVVNIVKSREKLAVETKPESKPIDESSEILFESDITTIPREPPVAIKPELLPKPTDLSNDDAFISAQDHPRLAGGQKSEINAHFPSQIIHNNERPEHTVSQRPSINRGSKPDEIPPASHQIATQPRPQSFAPIPTLDRTTKPQISAEDSKRLMAIYNAMRDNVYDYSTRGNVKPGQTGLENMGNTCFMNACLQALFQTPGLPDTFTKDSFIGKVNQNNPLGTKGVISAVFSALMDSVWSGEFMYFRPQLFLRVFANEINAMLVNGQQQDASEFYMMLLASLHEDTNQIVKGATPPSQNYCGGPDIRKEAVDFDRKQMKYSNSLMSRILYPRTISEVSCKSCGVQSITFEDINIIQVILPSSSMVRQASLLDCLRRCFSKTDIEGRWDCPKCKTARPASQKLSLWSLSSVIVIHLLRFTFTGEDYVKNEIPVEFDPNNLDMKQFVHSASPSSSETTYRLYSVTNHRGRLNSGHYTAYSQHLRTGDWFRFDDSTVSSARSSDINFSDAYILYYKRKGL